MAIGYYPGCSLEGTAEEFNMSVKETAAALEIQFDEIDDWNCCGASAAHQTNHVLSLALPGRTVALAAEQGFEKIFAPCAACSNRLIACQAAWADNRETRSEVEEVLDRKLPEKTLPVLNCIEMFQPHLDAIEEKAVNRQEGTKVACYYGCLLLRPPKIVSFDNPEDPSSMETIVEKLGAVPVDWGFKTECCGAAFAMSSTQSVTRLCARILTNAHEEGADCVVTACPLCHANLDMRQNKSELGFSMPILYLPQLIGLALGLGEEALGLNKHITPVDSILGANTAP